MPILVPIVMFGWIPLVLLMFASMPPRRAVLATFVLAWLFLPMASFKLHSLPDYNKITATCFGAAMGVALFDAERLMRFRLKWVDLPMILWVLAPLWSSLANSGTSAGNDDRLGWYDGLSAAFAQLVIWGIPYLVGRLYFTDSEALKELGVAMLAGGLVYVPLCLLEMRLSPQLHLWVYGFRQHAFNQTMRDGGYRPMVFMQHGLMVAMWMSMAGLVGFWLWWTGTVRRVWGLPVAYVVLPVLAVAVLARSQFAAILLAAGLGTLLLVRWFHLRLAVFALLAAAPVFMYARATSAMHGDWLIAKATETFGAERAQSLEYRIVNENYLIEKANERPGFGWGGWRRARIFNDEYGKDAVTDSLWIITYGNMGINGLLWLTLSLFLPAILLCFDHRSALWSHPVVAPVAAVALVGALHMLDHLMNGMINPVFMLCVGAGTAAHLNRRALVPARRPAQIWVPQGREFPVAGAPVAFPRTARAG